MTTAFRVSTIPATTSSSRLCSCTPSTTTSAAQGAALDGQQPDLGRYRATPHDEDRGQQQDAAGQADQLGVEGLGHRLGLHHEVGGGHREEGQHERPGQQLGDAEQPQLRQEDLDRGEKGSG